VEPRRVQGTDLDATVPAHPQLAALPSLAHQERDTRTNPLHNLGEHKREAHRNVAARGGADLEPDLSRNGYRHIITETEI
jgi:hypothetical protein